MKNKTNRFRVVNHLTNKFYKIFKSILNCIYLDLNDLVDFFPIGLATFYSLSFQKCIYLMVNYF